MTTRNDRTDTSTKTDAEPAPAVKVGDVVKVGDGYALVVGSEKVDHVGDRGERSTEWHPLVVDLPAARRLETEHSAAE